MLKRNQVLSYTDNEATLEVLDNGSGRFIEVRIKSDHNTKDKVAEAISLQKNKRTLFYFNSCNFPIVHEASCEVDKLLEFKSAFVVSVIYLHFNDVQGLF
jgi:hypothetical protein